MLKTFVRVTVLFSAGLFFSCGTTGNAVSSAPDKNSGSRELKVINSQSSIPAVQVETPASIYEKKIKDLKLSFVSVPKEVTAGRGFTEPFVIKAVKADGTPAQNIEISINYPESKKEGSVEFGFTTLTTGEDGTVSYKAATPSNSFNSELSAYPAGDITDHEIAEAASKAAVKTPFKVKTNRLMTGGTISIVDFTAAGKPITSNSDSSSKLLMALMQQGFKRIGNADFTNAILSEDSENVRKSAKTLLGNTSDFLVYGTVKYAGSVEKNETNGKFVLTMNGKITILNMKDSTNNGSIEKTVTVECDKEWNCAPEARKVMAEQFAKELLYSL